MWSDFVWRACPLRKELLFEMNLQSGRTDLDFEVPSKAAKAVSHFCLQDGAVKQLSFMHFPFVKLVPKLDTGMLCRWYEWHWKMFRAKMFLLHQCINIVSTRRTFNLAHVFRKKALRLEPHCIILSALLGMLVFQWPLNQGRKRPWPHEKAFWPSW